jgi:hypothetical protein
MLYEDTTTSALVAGIEFESSEPWTARTAEEIREALAEHNREHQTDLELIVPGDSSTEHSVKPDLALYSWGILIGLVPTMTHAPDGPREVDVDAAHAALREVAALPQSYWRELSERHELLSGIEDKRPRLFLTGFGPLPAAILAVGQRHPTDRRDQTTYKFFGLRRHAHRPDEQGVDGIDIATVDYADFIEVDLSPDAVERWLEKVRKLDEPKLYLGTKDD